MFRSQPDEGWRGDLKGLDSQSKASGMPGRQHLTVITDLERPLLILSYRLPSINSGPGLNEREKLS